jgi:hypothetical protein
MRLTYPLKHEPISTLTCFDYKGVILNRIENWTPDIDIDFIPFESLTIDDVGDGSEFIRLLRLHENYSISKQNPNVPVLFFHEHESLDPYHYSRFIQLVKKELKIKPRKIILFETNLFDRKGKINPPIKNKIRQFDIKVNDIEVDKIHKFTFLNNRTRKLRLEVLDKVIKSYDNDIKKLREENLVTFRNYIEINKWNRGISSDLSDIQKIIESSKEYTFHNDFEFYNNVGFPWTYDDFPVGGGFRDMHTKLYDIFSQSYFSIILETNWFYYNLEYKRTLREFVTFSEKVLAPIASGNLPFIIHGKEFYIQLEKAGFDFSYLKTLFGIDYKKNKLNKNFESIDKFINYIKSKSLDEINEDYQNLKPLIENNKQVLKKIQDKTLEPEIELFIQEVKNEKNSL